MTIARLGLKVKVSGQGQRSMSTKLLTQYNAVGLTLIFDRGQFF